MVVGSLLALAGIIYVSCVVKRNLNEAAEQKKKDLEAGNLGAMELAALELAKRRTTIYPDAF